MKEPSLNTLPTVTQLRNNHMELNPGVSYSKACDFSILLVTNDIKNSVPGTSPVAQWLRIHLPMQGTRVRALVWENPTCRRATKPVRHSYWACALEPASHNY